MKTLIAIIALSFTVSAFADQCAGVSKKVAKNATEFLKPGTKIGFLCEPCGDTKIKKATVKSVSIATLGGGLSEVLVNGKGVDLAYTYYLANGRTYYNIAGLVGCAAEGVSFSIEK